MRMTLDDFMAFCDGYLSRFLTTRLGLDLIYYCTSLNSCVNKLKDLSHRICQLKTYCQRSQELA